MCNSRSLFSGNISLFYYSSCILALEMKIKPAFQPLLLHFCTFGLCIPHKNTDLARTRTNLTLPLESVFCYLCHSFTASVPLIVILCRYTFRCSALLHLSLLCNVLHFLTLSLLCSVTHSHFIALCNVTLYTLYHFIAALCTATFSAIHYVLFALSLSLSSQHFIAGLLYLRGGLANLHRLHR